MQELRPKPARLPTALGEAAGGRAVAVVAGAEAEAEAEERCR